MDWLTVFIITRGIERLVIVLVSAICLWMGWRLFLEQGKQVTQSAEFSFKGALIKLQRVGPGVFFALFGATILTVITINCRLLRTFPHAGTSFDLIDQW